MLNVYTEYLKIKLRNLVGSEKGQGLVEYALIIALISIAAIGVMTTLGSDISTKFGKISTELTK